MTDSLNAYDHSNDFHSRPELVAAEASSDVAPVGPAFAAARVGTAALLDRFSRAVEAEMGPSGYRSWGSSFSVVAVDAERVTLGVTGELALVRLVDRVGQRKLRALWRDLDPQGRDLDFVAAPAPAEAASPPATTAGALLAGTSAVAVAGPGARVFETFVVGRCNQVAHGVARSIATAEEPLGRCAVIYGAYGAGKTHLLRAAEAAAGGAPRALYFSAHGFRDDFGRAMGGRTMPEFKQRLRSASLVIIDDLHMLGGSKQTQSELLNVITDALNDGGRVLLAADRPIDQITDLDPALRARLAGSVQAQIEKPDLDVRRRILSTMAAGNAFVRRGLAIPEEVFDFAAGAIVGTPRDLEAAFNTLIARTALVGLPVTFETAKDALSELLQGQPKKLSVEEIQKRVAAYHGLKVGELLAKKRSRDIVRPRQQAMYFCKELTTRSLPDIARRFGGMDHTTVMHAVKKIKELYDADPTMRAEIDAIRRDLRQPAAKSAE